MDVKDATYHTKIDPSGIDMSGNGNNIILDVESGKVGIGTNDPQSLLNIKCTGGTSSAPWTGASGLTIERSNSSHSWEFVNGHNNNLMIRNIDSEGTYKDNVLVLQDNGKVGIGTNDPKSLLNIKCTGGTSSAPWTGASGLTIERSNSSHSWEFVNGHNNNLMIRNIDSEGTYKDNVLVLQDNGKVGIGTNSPSSELDVAGTLSLTDLTPHHHGATSTAPPIEHPISLLFKKDLDLRYSYAHTRSVAAKISAVYDSNWYYAGSNALAFYTYYGNLNSNDYADSTIEKMRITSWGNVGIGTTTPAEKLHVNGNVKASAGILTSDDRIKHNEVDISGALASLNKITTKHYLKTLEIYEPDTQLTIDGSGNVLDPSGNIIKDYIYESGIIAQELRNIPELAFCVKGEEYRDDIVTIYEKDLSDNFVLDSSGNQIATGTETTRVKTTLGVDYNSIFTTHIQATQELSRRNDALVAENAQLKTRMETLEAAVIVLQNK